MGEVLYYEVMRIFEDLDTMVNLDLDALDIDWIEDITREVIDD